VTLTREQILAARVDRKPQRLEVPEWGGEVYIRVLSARDQMALSDSSKPEETPIRVLLHSIVDEHGERILRDEDFEALAGEDFPIIMRIFGSAAKLNGFSNKELEAAIENFGPSPNGAKPSESLLPLD
jgi:hypothetical protein